MKNEDRLTSCNYKTYEFEDMLEMDTSFDPTDNFLGDMDIANLIDNNWIFEHVSSVALTDSTLDGTLGLGGATDDSHVDDGRLGLKHESGGSVLSCVSGIQEQLIGFDEGEGRVLGGSRSSGGSSPESGHFTGSNASGDEHSASPEMSPGTNYDLTLVENYVTDKAQNVWAIHPPGTNVDLGEGGAQIEFSGSSGHRTFCPEGETQWEKQKLQQIARPAPMLLANVQKQNFVSDISMKVPQYSNLSPSGSTYSSDSTESYETTEHNETTQYIRLPIKKKRDSLVTNLRQFAIAREPMPSNKSEILKRCRTQTVQATELSENMNGRFYFTGLPLQGQKVVNNLSNLNGNPAPLLQTLAPVVDARMGGPSELILADVYQPKRAKLVNQPKCTNDEAMLDVATQKIEDSGSELLEEKEENLSKGAISVLQLTEEEVAVYESECLPLPKSGGPLSRMDEKNLKRVRRKLKNKWSAQESRRKKKEYLETLEEKCSSVSSENNFLKRRVSDLEYDNRTLLGQLGRLQELICSFGGTRLKCTDGANTGLMTAAGPGSGSISAGQPHGSRNTNGNNSTVLMMFTVLLATMVSVLSPCVTDLQALLSFDDSLVPTSTAGENGVAASSSEALRNLRSSAFLLSPFAPTKFMLGQQFVYKSFQEEMKSRVLFTPAELPSAETSSPSLPRVSDKSPPIAGTEMAKPLIGFDLSERHLELWLSEQNDHENEPWMDFSEDDEAHFIIASTMENVDYDLDPVPMAASIFYPIGGNVSVNLSKSGRQQVADAQKFGVLTPGCCQTRITAPENGFMGDVGNVTLPHGVCF